MRVAINAWFLSQLTTGSGQYLVHFLSAYAAHDTGDTFFLCKQVEADFVDRASGPCKAARQPHAGKPQSTAPDLDGPTLLSPRFEWQTLRTPFDGQSRHLAKLWFEQIAFPRACRRWGADLIHVPYWASPLFSSIPTIVTIHDLIPVLLPAYQGGALGRLYSLLVTLSARRATRVLTDSEASRQDIIHHLRIPADRVEAIPLAVQARFQPIQDPALLARVRQKYGLPGHYLLYLGGYDVRKNVSGILHAFSRQSAPHAHLVLAGQLPSQDSRMFPDPRRMAAELGIRDRVHLTGWVDEEDKPAMHSAAVAFVFPSHYEGFGLPPLEAMSCGTPVIVSNRSSLPEIVGKGGLCVDPDDVDALAGAMRQVLSDGSLRERLRTAGRMQARHFSWRKTAQDTTSAYQYVLSTRSVTR
jgi:glycosyltransferase involved in cell wall biosynthesis